MIYENEPEPDNIEKGIRFGCGGLLGFVLGLYCFLHGIFGESRFGIILLFICLILFFGFLAMRYGDKFWNSIKDWL